MGNGKQTEPAQADREKPAQTPESDQSGRQAQIDEARDEGAGKIAVPIDQTSTANDK